MSGFWSDARLFLLIVAIFGLGPAVADGLTLATPSGPNTQGQCFASGASGPRVPCVLQGQTWTRVLRPTDPADGMTVNGRPLTGVIKGDGGKTTLTPDGLTVGSVPTYQAGAQPDAAVSLGGTYGFESLADPTAAGRFRASGRGGYYLHYSAVDNPQLTSIAAAFAGTGPGVVEVSYGGGFNPGFWGRSDYQQKVVGKGFRPAAAIVNIDTSDAQFSTRWSDSVGFKAFVDAARRDGGVKVLAPITSPNQSGGPGAAGDAASVAVIHPWSDAWWDDIRAAALYGGGIALDSPPKFYFEGLPTTVQQQAYQQFSQEVIAWGHANNLWVSVLVSPYTEQNFEAYARRFYDTLRAADRLPSHWAVINYNACGTASGFPTACQPGDAAYYSPVGTESTANTQAAAALWYARNAKVRPYTGTYAGMVSRPAAQVAPATIAGRDGADQRINAADIDGLGTAAAQSAEAPVFGSPTMDNATVNGALAVGIVNGSTGNFGASNAGKARVMWGLSGPVSSSDAAQTVQNTDISADTILAPITASGLFYADNLRNAVVVPPGTKAVAVSAHGCYLRNDNPVTKDPTYGETVGVGVCDWGVALANADNAAVWGAARYLSDTANNSVPVPNRKGVGLIGYEMDYHTTSTDTTVAGINLLLGGSAVPKGAVGFSCGGLPFWSDCFVARDGSARPGAPSLNLGAASTSGSNVASQYAQWNWFDGSGARQLWKMGARTDGVLSISSTSGKPLNIDAPIYAQRVYTTEGAPTLTNCGSGASLAAGSSDRGGAVIPGAGATSCTVNFAAPYATAAFPVATPAYNIGSATYYIAAQSKNGFQLSWSAAAAGQAFNYSVTGN